jgi:glycerol-3-phosphate acyltransferase PlsX
MPDKVRIAIDAMGGDHGPSVVLPGAEISLIRHPDIEYLLFGNSEAVEPLLAKMPVLKARSKFVHTEVSIRMDDKPSQALRYGRWKSSMWLALDAVKKGEADVTVSAGNTGALMAMAKLSLRMMPGIDRPALAAMMPTLGENDVVVLDLGANAECDARNLVQFAVMGAAYARTTLDLASPRVALLNIGSEDQKGTDEIREAAQTIKAATHLPLTFTGFIEGDRLSRGDVDVIVCDGFSGNIALKTADLSATCSSALSAARSAPRSAS